MISSEEEGAQAKSSDSSASVASSTSSSSFRDFATTCERIKSTPSKLKKIDALACYLSALVNDDDLRIAVTFLSGRIFAPGSEEREVNVGYSLIWRAISDMFSLSGNDLGSYYMKHGDLGSALEEILLEGKVRRRVSIIEFDGKPALTLHSFFGAVRELAKSGGHGSTTRRFQILQRILASLSSPVEAKYFVKLITGEMRIGLVEGLVEESVAKAFAKSLEEVRTANLVSGNVGLVAVLAKKDDLSKAKLEVLRPTNFMLADSAQNAQELFRKFTASPILSEFKYDGIRAQVHLRNNQVRIFSRNLAEISEFFPELELPIVGTKERSMILDGEILAFDDGRPLSFQLLQRRLRKKTITRSDAPVNYMAFDLLFLNGEPLISKPLSERLSRLRSIRFRQPILVSDQRQVSSAEEVGAMFVESKASGFEGLVVKDPASLYTPGRRGKSWVKLKKELDTLDVVIIGAEYGHGKRAGVISDYTFAVKDGQDLKVVGKAYSGLSDAEIQEMTATLKSITTEDYGYRRKVKPFVVLEIAFDAIQKSERHDSGFALRFPRIKAIRSDKSVSDIDTLERVKAIFEAQHAKV